MKSGTQTKLEVADGGHEELKFGYIQIQYIEVLNIQSRSQTSSTIAFLAYAAAPGAPHTIQPAQDIPGPTPCGPIWLIQGASTHTYLYAY